MNKSAIVTHKHVTGTRTFREFPRLTPLIFLQPIVYVKDLRTPRVHLFFTHNDEIHYATERKFVTPPVKSAQIHQNAKPVAVYNLRIITHSLTGSV